MSKDLFYKQVFIFGYDSSSDDPLKAVIKRIEPAAGILIIGDRSRSVGLQEIEQLTSGRINEATRIDICAHGGLGDKKQHRLRLFVDKVIGTRYLFEALARASNGKALYVRLWSCYSANASKDYSLLPAHSLLIMNSNKNTITYSFDNVGNFGYQEFDGTAYGAKRNVIASLEPLIKFGAVFRMHDERRRDVKISYAFKELEEEKSFYKRLLRQVYSFIKKCFSNVRKFSIYATNDVEKDLKELSRLVAQVLKISEKSEGKIKIDNSLREERDSLRLMLLIHHLSSDPMRLLKAIRVSKINLKQVNYILDIIFLELFERDLQILELFLQNGLNPKGRNLGKWQITPTSKNKECFELLVKYGADVNQSLQDGETPLSVALKYPELAETSRHLLELGANPFLGKAMSAISLQANRIIINFIKTQPDPMKYLMGLNPEPY